MEFLTEATGTIAAIFTTTSFLPQAVKTMRSGDTKSISLTMYVFFVTGVFLWIIFGVLINTKIIVAANLITFLLSGAILVMKIRNRKRDKR